MTIVLCTLVLVLGVLAALALVLRGTKPDERAELVRALAELFWPPRGPGNNSSSQLPPGNST